MKRWVLVIGVLGIFFTAPAAQADWTPAKRITWTSGKSCCPAVAVDSGGNIHVVWYDNAAGNNEVYYKKTSDGGATWSVAKRLTWNSGNSQGASIAIDAGNAIHIVWYDATPGKWEIFYNRSTDTGTTWGVTKRLTSTSGSSYDPVIAADSDDTLHVVWYDDTPGNQEIYYMRSTNGGTAWGAARRLTWTSGDSANSAIDASDGVHVVWTDDTLGNQEIYYRRSTDGGTTWSVVQRLTWTSTHALNPAIAIDSGNTIHILWSELKGVFFEILYKASPDGGTTWSAVKRLTWTSGSSRHPAIAIDPSDNLHITWDDDTPGNQEIYYRQSPDGGTTWSAVKRLTWTSGSSSYSALSTDSSNDIYVAWNDDTPGNFEIFYKKGN